MGMSPSNQNHLHSQECSIEHQPTQVVPHQVLPPRLLVH